MSRNKIYVYAYIYTYIAVYRENCLKIVKAKQKF